jgi:hypothetical protein
MAAANAVRQWEERQEQEPALWTTEEADVASAVVEKRQLGIAVTLGGAVFSVGLDSNGLPAFTIGPPAPTPTPTPTAPRVTQTVDSIVTEISAPAPAPTPTTALAPVETSAIIEPAPSSEVIGPSGKHVFTHPIPIVYASAPYHPFSSFASHKSAT